MEDENRALKEEIANLRAEADQALEDNRALKEEIDDLENDAEATKMQLAVVKHLEE